MMLSKIILLYLFIQLSSGCTSITDRGVPYIPLGVCLGFRFDTDGYYQIICDAAETGIIFSMHSTSDCSDSAIRTSAGTLDDDEAVDCEPIACSYATYKSYNDTIGQCLHSTTTPFQEYALVMDECGYDTLIAGSINRSCDATAIYLHYEIGDTEGLCENTIEFESVRIETGCDDDDGMYREVTECIYYPHLPPPPDNGLSTGAIVGIVIAVIAVLLIGIGIAVYCYYINRKKKDTKYSAVPKERAEEKQTKPIVVTRAQMQPPTQAPPPFRPQMQQTHETQPAPPPAFRPQQTYQPQAQQVPPSPPPPVQTIKEIYIKETEQKPPPAFQPEIQSIPFTAPGPSSSPSPPPPPTDQENVSLIQNGKHVISDWLQQNAQISEIDANKYADIFIENGFEDLKLLKEITIDELVEIGISKLGHRKAIIKAIQSDEMVLQPIC